MAVTSHINLRTYTLTSSSVTARGVVVSYRDYINITGIQSTMPVLINRSPGEEEFSMSASLGIEAREGS